MKFGVNYTPSHGWFHAWLDPDWDGIDNDLKQISELGMDHVRIFPIWPYLQPNRTWINKKGVADVRRMVHIAGEHGLDALRATCSPMRTPLRPSVNWSRP